MIRDNPLHMVPVTQADALSLKQPAVMPGVIPLGSYRGYPPQPEIDLPTAVLDRLLIVRSDLDRNLVYKFTRAVFERRSEILEKSRLAGFIGPLADDDKSAIPAHPGARSYFDREKPGFMQQNARLASAMLYVIAIVTSALLALRTHWVRSRRVRMNVYNQRLMAIAHRVRQERSQAELATSKDELMDILSEVIDELESERVSQSEFEHFSFTWQAVDALVRDQFTLAGIAVEAPFREVSA
jgi:CRISPR/Cas system CSM-associated protein Csm2 small subunit